MERDNQGHTETLTKDNTDIVTITGRRRIPSQQLERGSSSSVSALATQAITKGVRTDFGLASKSSASLCTIDFP